MIVEVLYDTYTYITNTLNFPSVTRLSNAEVTVKKRSNSLVATQPRIQGIPEK